MLSQLLLCFSGIFFSYLINGYAIEYLTTTFGKKIFTFYMVMILTPSFCNAIFGKILILRSKEKHVGSIPKWFYFFCSFFQMASMVSANAALAYIPYPTQLVLKSSKPIFILFAGIICLSKGIHHPSRILSTLIIVFGIMGFMYRQYQVKAESSRHPDVLFFDNLFGLILVFISLLFDALMGYIQDRTRSKYTLNTNQMIYQINLYSCCLLTAGIILTNELTSFIKFFMENPSVILYLLLIGITGAIGQSFIFYTISTFGPLTCSIITNVRKFFQLFLSAILFSHVVTFSMFSFLLIVFGGLILDVWSQFKFRSKPKAKVTSLV